MKLLIVGGNNAFQAGLVSCLRGLDPAPELIVANDIASALRYIECHSDLDLVLLDLELADSSGARSYLILHERSSDIPVVILSGEENESVINTCIDHGALGFITKSATYDDVLNAIRMILSSTVFLPRHSSPAPACVHDANSTDSIHCQQFESLSERQRQVLAYMLQGKPNKTISRRLDISENTVKAHLSAIFRILGARNRTEAVYFAARAGMFPILPQSEADRKVVE